VTPPIAMWSGDRKEGQLSFQGAPVATGKYRADELIKASLSLTKNAPFKQRQPAQFRHDRECSEAANLVSGTALGVRSRSDVYSTTFFRMEALNCPAEQPIED
jgi:hypothetical protein